ncbi:FAD-dependent oxidoreductase [Salinarimonas soli]|uniref:FAD-dependent oxidoreductase n=1 Tax=Salinarimonas soli TaxID=1638099 RepID=A0A5B2VF98_9HYPH|nr:FAD-dependent oxidoreductase [Salinarimonas soli]KAA2236867.1 FAD-dependent oxidoreductase [Salinarimonas soli]
MSRVVREVPEFEAEVPLLVVGGGAAGLVAALAAREAGVEALVLERDPVPRGSTALSAGLVPAAGTRWQRAAGIEDSPALFAADILKKAHGEPDAAAVAAVTETVGPVLEWLAGRHGLPFSLIEDFRYPGHSALRMHGLPSRSGEELIDRLRAAAEAAGVDILPEAHVVALFADASDRVAGVEIARPDGSRERIGCGRLILACNGYGGHRDLVRRHVPDLAEGLYFGHPGNQGDAVLWGEALGAATRHLSGHQGHGSVAHPHGILITWAVIMEGGFQVNLEGRRFADETGGYSEAAAPVLAQPEGLAVCVFDARIAGIARQFEDFRRAEAAGAVPQADTPDALAGRLGLPVEAFMATFEAVEACKRRGDTDDFGRSFAGVPPLAPPYHAVRVTGALFHTQGGLVVDGRARVLRPDGSALPNLYAAGGAACGVSGSRASGYLSGNGLLTAVAYGALAGRAEP